MRRSLLAALFALMLLAWPIAAQETPWRLVQGGDGVLFVIRGDTKHRIVPAVMTDADMAIPEGVAWEDGDMLVASAPPAALAPAPAAPAPPPAAGKRIGDTTVLTGPSGLRLAVTVNAFEDGASSNNPRRMPRGRWAVVDWTVKNEGATEISVNRLHFKLQTTDGYVIEREGLSIRETDLETDQLGPGQIVRGWLTYDVPAGQKIKSIIYQPSGERQFVIVDLP